MVCVELSDYPEYELHLCIDKMPTMGGMLYFV